ncbi:CNH domain-containing protein [Pilobolus umbonatus]|nr:CNH domain-containing protein [Pilobolus umbonatus]
MNQYQSTVETMLLDCVDMVTHTDSKVTPAEAFRNRYYLSQQNHQGEDNMLEDEYDDFIYRPGAIIYAPLNTSLSDTTKPSTKDSDTPIAFEEDNISVKTIESYHTDTFTTKPLIEPKIVLENEWDTQKDMKHTAMSNSTLLSKLCKTTAPMRAKLSTLSRSKTSFEYLWASSSTTLTLPLRKSTESVADMSLSAKSKKERSQSKKGRSNSFSFNKTIDSGLNNSPIECLYPALLSQVAISLKEHTNIGTKTKDSIEYHDVFDGKEAVNKLCSIIKTSDRSLAMLLGRALYYQKFFHDVSYEHRLRDSGSELYQFRQTPIIQKRTKKKLCINPGDNDIMQTANHDTENNMTMGENPNDNYLPNGVFTVLTDCYSSTCTNDKTCYSYTCPRKQNEHTRVTLEKQSLHRVPSQSSLHDNEDRLWIKKVSASVANSLSKQERRRQENIFELIYTEQDFVNDLDYIEKYWITALKYHECLPDDRRDQYITDLFWNITKVKQTNHALLEDLIKRQSESPVIHEIGDILLNHVILFEPFVEYGSHQFISKYHFETEKSSNPAFAELVESIERLNASRRLELNGYLTKPTTRLGRYNLLLKEILKHTPASHPDGETIPKVMSIIGQYLGRINEESGITENRFSLKILHDKLSFRKCPELKTLDLLSENRRIIMKGPLKRKSVNSTFESSDLQVYVLDECVLIIKSKYFDNVERFKLHRKPIPIGLLSILLPDQTKRSSSFLSYTRTSTGSFYTTGNAEFLPPLVTSTSQNKSGYPISFVHLGREGSGTTTLYASTYASRKKWVDTIERHKHSIMKKLKVFRMVPISDQFFNSFNKVNCAAVYGPYIVIGCDHGIYLKSMQPQEHLEEGDEGLFRILMLDKVSQIEILEGPKLMLILADKNFYTYSIESIIDNKLAMSEWKEIQSKENVEGGQRLFHPIKNNNIRKINNNVSFFKVGKVLDKSNADRIIERTLVCYVKNNTIMSTIRALEPYVESEEAKKKKRKSHKPHLGLFARNPTEILRVFKDLYIPGEASSIQFFKSVICVGSAKGFQMVDIVTTRVQSVLDPSDERHNFINQRETLRPISMFRHPNDSILLCYNEIAFYIDKKGKRLRDEWLIRWEGSPSSFAFHYPYVIAFDASFIEIRHMDEGDLIQIITGNNIRCLRSDTPDCIYCAMDDQRTGNEFVFRLHFTGPND